MVVRPGTCGTRCDGMGLRSRWNSGYGWQGNTRLGCWTGTHLKSPFVGSMYSCFKNVGIMIHRSLMKKCGGEEESSTFKQGRALLRAASLRGYDVLLTCVCCYEPCALTEDLYFLASGKHTPARSNRVVVDVRVLL